MTVAPLTLEQICDDGAGESYPRDVLAGCETALVLFAAAFLGRQDAYWIAEAGLRGTCVDVDFDKLEEMAAIYPTDWEFVAKDAYAFAEGCGDMFDIVSIDCPSNHFDRVADLAALWCDLARKAVIMGASRESAARIQRPSTAWALHELRRRSDFNGGTYWAVISLP